MSPRHRLLDYPLPPRGEVIAWPEAASSSRLALAIAEAARSLDGPLLVVAPDAQHLESLAQACGFFLGNALPVVQLPDRDVLPYDVFSPSAFVTSQRLEALSQLLQLERGVVLVSPLAFLERLPPRDYLGANVFSFKVGQALKPEVLCARLAEAGYVHADQVEEPGCFNRHGAMVDCFPMGSKVPYRIEFYDARIESIRTFDPATQRSAAPVKSMRLVPGRECPLQKEAIDRFRRAFRATFGNETQRSIVYTEVSAGRAVPGIESYLPLFFEHTATLAELVAPSTTMLWCPVPWQALWADVERRFALRQGDLQRPALPPETLFVPPGQILEAVLSLGHVFLDEPPAGDTGALPELPGTEPKERLAALMATGLERVLVTAVSPGRREALKAELGDAVRLVPDWHGFAARQESGAALTLGELERGFFLPAAGLAVVTEEELAGRMPLPRRRRQGASRDLSAIIRDLTDLTIGSIVVHRDHGIGRYLGLTRLEAGGIEEELLVLEYLGGDKVYVPVTRCEDVSRYTGNPNPELHRLGGAEWGKAKQKAAQKARDVAAELLEVYARRQASQAQPLEIAEADYQAFARQFPFEETPDQDKAIAAVLADMAREVPMDRVVCGDVGFGKTEVALRAAFVAASAGKQVAVLVPTTLLADQHLRNFQDRLADTAIRVARLSRLSAKGEERTTLEALARGSVDIVIGTQALLRDEVRFKDLGLVIVDEEHRFGVRAKERLKALRPNVHCLTLTATPIPRTLSMSLAGLRDLSIIATPPQDRLPVETTACEWDQATMAEAISRELRRGGQVYAIHNRIEDIETFARHIQEAAPQATIRIAHGAMRERELEAVMRDFYQRRFTVLVATTIVESGLDVPTANTIIIHRADLLGLAQLHQLRGRVGRSFHRAFCYLVLPPQAVMTADAKRRIEALLASDGLGAGFLLATHDLEIRGAGELLGEEQSGEMLAVGFEMYNEMLAQAVAALKSGTLPEVDLIAPHERTTVDVAASTLFPETYMPDVRTRLVYYKRLAAVKDVKAVREIEQDVIDRFGALPPPAQCLMAVTRLRLTAAALGIQSVSIQAKGGKVIFAQHTTVDPSHLLELMRQYQGRLTFDGPQAVRLAGPFATPEARLAAAQDLLAHLAQPAEPAQARSKGRAAG